MFVLKRYGKGLAYVAPAGSRKSYTSSIAKARKFATVEEAERERCGNERTMSVDDVLMGRN